MWILGIFAVGMVLNGFTSSLITKEDKINKVFIDILVAIDVVTAGGIAEGYAIYIAFVKLYQESLLLSILVFLGMSILIYTLSPISFLIINKDRYKLLEIVAFTLVFIIASVCWAQPITNYFNNIEKIDETLVIDEQENQLLYFCNIPVQQLSGSISGNLSGSALWAGGNISGSISTLEELQYWYLNGNGEGEYESAPTNSSKIRFIEENEQTYVKVITYRNQIRTVNHNNGEETTVIQSEWQEYIFYLPQAIMQYPLE